MSLVGRVIYVSVIHFIQALCIRLGCTADIMQIYKANITGIRDTGKKSVILCRRSTGAIRRI